MIVQNIFDDFRDKIDLFDLELIISHVLGKTREFVLAHPEYIIPKFKIKNLKFKIARRRHGEPLAYILGQKEFYGLNFKVTRQTLIPRPETELLVEKSLYLLRSMLRNSSVALIDVGTGSGNIIISIVKNLNVFCHSNKNGNDNCNFYATDISEKALRVAKSNAKKHDFGKKIKFIKSDILSYFLKVKSYPLKASELIIAANLPYLSKKIYNATAPDIKKYEPKSSLYSKNAGLDHYEKLFRQIKLLKINCFAPCVTCYLEISPEQKPKIQKLIGKYFSSASFAFSKDLAQKWRVAMIKINKNPI